MELSTIQQAEVALTQSDPILGKLIARQGAIQHQPRNDYFASLARAIIGQQLSVVAASRIFERFSELTGIQPEKVITLDEQQIKAVGLSRPKARYIQDLARHFVNDSAILDHLDTLSDDNVIQELTAIKGIGIWTAQMFLMFTLTRPDVFALDDVGLQNAVTRLYGLKQAPNRSELEQFAERWRPYRTVACWHLWRSLDNEPTK